MKKNLKLYSIPIICIIIFTAIIFAFSWIFNRATIEILVAPSNATVYINDKEYKTNQTLTVSPGDYNIRIEKEGFTSFNNKVTLHNNDIFYLYEVLIYNSDGENYYSTNKDDEILAEKIYLKKAEKIKQQDSDIIWSITPYINPTDKYRIYASRDNNSSNTTINIKAYSCDDSRVREIRNKAIEYLKTNKVNINNYIFNISRSC